MSPATRELNLVTSTIVLSVIVLVLSVALCGVPYLLVRDLLSLALEAPCP